MQNLEGIQEKNLENVAKATSQHMLAGLDNEKHGKGVVEYIQDKYKFDKDKVSSDRMENDAADLLINHINKRLSKDSIHREYKTHPKKK